MMKVRWLPVVVVALALVVMAFPTRSQNQDVQASGLRAVPLGYQQITALSASTALTVPIGASFAVIVPETQAVRYRDDGTAPTGSVGQPLAVGVVLTYAGNLAAIRFIEQAASAKLNVLYYR
jgi:hypothetical protein